MIFQKKNYQPILIFDNLDNTYLRINSSRLNIVLKQKGEEVIPYNCINT